MSLGARLAGIDVTVAVEKDVHSAKTYHENHPNCNILVKDVRTIDNHTVANIPKGNKGTVVLGGPPYQGFSYSNTRTRTMANEN